MFISAYWVWRGKTATYLKLGIIYLNFDTTYLNFGAKYLIFENVCQCLLGMAWQDSDHVVGRDLEPCLGMSVS